MSESDIPSGNAIEESTRSVAIPATRSWWRRLLAFAGPAYMVSVGYMDPGNWATDIEGGSKFGYQLLWVLLMSNVMAILLQTLSTRLGLVTGRDLAQACRDEYPDFVRFGLFVLCEIAVAATDLAEVIGTAVGLNLLLGLPVLWGVVITGFDVLLLLVIQRLGIRKIEAFIVLLVSTVGFCYVIELFLAKPSLGGIAQGFVPRLTSIDQVYVAMGILGATVMPHSLYLHSSLVQSRNVSRSLPAVRQACKYNFIDSMVAMNGAFFVNAAILIVAAAAFWQKQEVTELQQAHSLLSVLGGAAPAAFAIGLLCAGQSSTVTGTLAGQIVMEGFLNIRLRPWLRRLLTRGLAIIPAIMVILAIGDKAVYQLLILSQVVLSLQLPFAIVPLIKFTGSRRKMGPFATRPWVQVLSWLVAVVIIGLNGWLVAGKASEWITLGGTAAWATILTIGPISLCLAVLLGWMIVRKEPPPLVREAVTADQIARASREHRPQFRRIGAALETTARDAGVVAEAVSLARIHGAQLVLLHIVEGVGGQWYGPQTGDQESRRDELYLEELAQRLGQQLAGQDIPAVRAVLGYGGNVAREIVRIVRREEIDLLIMGTHGHRGLGDIWHGQTIDAVRHQIKIPVLAVR